MILSHLAFCQSAKAGERNHYQEAKGVGAEAKSTAKEANTYIPHYGNNEGISKNEALAGNSGLYFTKKRISNTQYPSRYKQNAIQGRQLNTPYRQSPKRYQQITILHHHITNSKLLIFLHFREVEISFDFSVLIRI